MTDGGRACRRAMDDENQNTHTHTKRSVCGVVGFVVGWSAQPDTNAGKSGAHTTGRGHDNDENH